MIPLYQNATHFPKIDNRSHKGLIFDKFYEWDNPGKELKEQKKEINIQRVSGICGDYNLIEQFALKHLQMLNSIGGAYEVYTNSWNFVTGMGIDHPLENGMLWHPILGTPYLSGSAVKGMLRAFCEVWAGWETQKIEKVFGKAADKDSQGSSGSFIFFDAIPVAQATLTADVMTPHMGEWYQRGEETPHTFDTLPGDWHSPVPVTFLAVEKISLLFSIAPGNRSVDETELHELFDALTSALEWVGAGAKTSAGYGRFAPDKSKKTGLEDEIEKHMETTEISANLSPVEAMIFQLEQQKTNKEEKKDVTILEAIEAGRFDDIENGKCEALKIVKEEMIKLKNWIETSKKPDRDKKYKRTKKVIKMLQECEQ